MHLVTTEEQVRAYGEQQRSLEDWQEWFDSRVETPPKVLSVTTDHFGTTVLHLQFGSALTQIPLVTPFGSASELITRNDGTAYVTIVPKSF
jgi:hypothetical protein